MAVRAARYVVKRRIMELHARGTVSKVRAVSRWSPWAVVSDAETLSEAQIAIKDLQRNPTAGRWKYREEPGKIAPYGKPDYAVFHRGLRCWP